MRQSLGRISSSRHALSIWRPWSPASYSDAHRAIRPSAAQRNLDLGPNRRRSRDNARHRLADTQAETKQQEVPAPITFAVRNKCVQRVRVVLVSNLSRLDPTEREWLPLVWPDLESRGVGTDPSPPDPVGLDKWLYESGTRPEDYAASDRFMDTYVQAALARASTSSPSRGQLAKDGSIRLVSGVSSALLLAMPYRISARSSSRSAHAVCGRCG